MSVRNNSFTILVEELHENLDIPFNLLRRLPVEGQPERIPRSQTAALISDQIQVINLSSELG